MNPGTLLLILAVVAALVAALLHAPTLAGRPAMRGARAAFVLHAGLLLAAMGLLAAHFVAHHFAYEYVAEYSSRALSPAMAIAASWAGQEGSILLWALFGGAIGVALMLQPGALVRPAMVVVGATQAALLALVLVRDPFRVTAVVPLDGQGLNPLLNDPWMVIHPPFLFLGYATLVAPFALTVAALARGAWDEWNRSVWPWALMATLALGVGIALGGVWAYTVLGWGGYWGWDPVENASLVPWLIAVALLHGLMIQRATGALVRTNLVLAAIAWLSVLGGTYLTRSGILADFSVHSFSDSGLNGPLTAILVGTLVLSVGLLTLRWRAIASKTASWTAATRGSALWLGLWTVVVLAGLVTLGTTAPLLTMLAGKPANVQPAYYKQIILPLGFLILFLMAVGPALRWSRQEKRSWISTLLPGLAFGALVVAWGIASGLTAPGSLALAAAAGLAVGMNLWMMASLFRRGWRYGAGALGHFGIAVMALGMLVSGALGRTERLRIGEGETVTALGRQVTYRGSEPGAMGAHVLSFTVADKRGGAFEARPRLLPAMRGEGMIHTPAISMWREIYVSPLELQEVPVLAENAASEAKAEPDMPGIVWLPKNQPVQMGDATLTFRHFRMEGGQHLRVVADIDLTRDGKSGGITPSVEAGPDGMKGVPLDVPGIGPFMVVKIDADHGRVAVHAPRLAAAGHSPVAAGVAPRTLTPARYALVEVSTKPLINLVWIGAILSLVGTALAGWRRARQESYAARRTAVTASA